MRCPLCQSLQSESFQVHEKTLFWQCSQCDLIFKDNSLRLTPDAEKARYDTHRNGDEGHQNFLRPIVEAVQDHVPRGARGLDWGSGPVPVLSQMLRAASYDMTIYDPFYQPVMPQGQFDFVTMTEVIEHCYEPAQDLSLISDHLRPGGFFFIMTETHSGREDLPNWYYWKDPTHVSFFSPRTFEFFEDTFGLSFLGGEGRLWGFRRL